MGTTHHLRTWDRKPRLSGENHKISSNREDGPDEGLWFPLSDKQALHSDFISEIMEFMSSVPTNPSGSATLILSLGCFLEGSWKLQLPFPERPRHVL
ncbi:hypothetical protein TNCV_1285981 [Trichonephila clavipes]|uniref:Uncharacterized protein n=1 Tax=Trichonephila clavipes TaxID=2585209 RepID=A0A8X6VP94_TRICX|nr:hypothetical protein TNCV_1285981 [Trichonephila clavipes]